MEASAWRVPGAGDMSSGVPARPRGLGPLLPRVPSELGLLPGVGGGGPPGPGLVGLWAEVWIQPRVPPLQGSGPSLQVSAQPLAHHHGFLSTLS